MLLLDILKPPTTEGRKGVRMLDDAGRPSAKENPLVLPDVDLSPVPLPSTDLHRPCTGLGVSESSHCVADKSWTSARSRQGSSVKIDASGGFNVGCSGKVSSHVDVSRAWGYPKTTASPVIFLGRENSARRPKYPDSREEGPASTVRLWLGGERRVGRAGRGLHHRDRRQQYDLSTAQVVVR